jgi:hypothetical protein
MSSQTQLHTISFWRNIDPHDILREYVFRYMVIDENEYEKMKAIYLRLNELSDDSAFVCIISPTFEGCVRETHEIIEKISCELYPEFSTMSVEERILYTNVVMKASPYTKMGSLLKYGYMDKNLPFILMNHANISKDLNQGIISNNKPFYDGYDYQRIFSMADPSLKEELSNLVKDFSKK